MRWWKANERYLVDRTPVANVGIVWSQRNTDFFGRDAAADVVDAPYTGFMHALVRARIPYLPVHADDIDRQAARLKLLILPNVGALSDAQAAAIRRFVAARRIAGRDRRDAACTTSGATPRPDFALADLFACHRPARRRDTPGGGRARRRGSDRRVCAEPQRPYLPAADPGAARACRRSRSR